MSATIVPCTCPECQQELQVVIQPAFRGEPLTLATCKNPQCPIFRTTLSPDGWEAITPEQIEGYKQANIRSKWLSRVVAVGQVAK